MKKVNSGMLKFVLVMLVGSLMVSCGNKPENRQQTASGAKKEVAQQTANPPAKSSTDPVIAAYLELKDALIASDAAKAKQAASDLESKLAEPSDEGLKTVIGSISATDDLEKQREAFFNLSKHMVTYVADNKPEGAQLYQQYCPMAFNNTGAYWISNSKEVLNPYFGDKMLKCGKVEKAL